jgi:metal-sulfur cluster biosynthetic enzyme
MTEQDVRDILSHLLDPDVGVNIVDLGLVESVTVEPGRVHVGLIMTTPACPQSSYLRDEAIRMLGRPGVEVVVDILDAPFWEPSRMSASAKSIMGWPG